MEEKLSFKSYTGYTIVEVANSLAFSVIGIYLVVFYSDILRIPLIAISAIMVAIRIFDGINDPIIGFWIQSRKPGKGGKFRPFLLWCALPIGIALLLMFTKIPNVNMTFTIIFALSLYVMFSIIFTMIQVSYGSLAAVMTRNETERSNLSIARSIGGGIGGLPAAILFPLFIFYTVVTDDGDSFDVLDYEKLFLAIMVIAILMAIVYSLGYFTTEERYKYPDEKQKINIIGTIKILIKNKAFIIMSLASMFLIAGQMFIGAINIYLFKDYYGESRLLTLLTIIFYLPMPILIPFVNKIIKKFGKKEACLTGLAISSVVCFIMWVARISNPIVYIALSFFQGLGISFFTLEVWAMALDVIDYQEMLSKKREEASSFALFTLMRKMGQSLAALTPALLFAIGYDTELIGQGQSQATLDGLYTIATFVPFVVLSIMTILMFIYPLNKQKTIEMRQTLELQRQSYE